MAEQIIIDDRDPQKKEVFDAFFSDTTKTGAFLDREITLTDADYEELFTKIAAHDKVNSFNDFKSTVHDTFSGKLDNEVAKWEQKLALDRTRLNDLFGKETK